MRTLLTAVRGIDSEPVIVDTDAQDVVVLELDDGERLELDKGELLAALGKAA